MKETLEVNDRSTRNYFTSSHTSHQYSPRSWRLKKKTRKVRFKKCATWTSTDCLSGSLNIYCSFGRIKVLPYALAASTNRGVRYIVIRFFAPIIIRPPELSLFRTSDRSTIVNNEVCRALPAMKQGCLRRRETWYIISFMNQKSLGIHTHDGQLTRESQPDEHAWLRATQRHELMEWRRRDDAADCYFNYKCGHTLWLN